jgi:hypothetical protein
VLNKKNIAALFLLFYFIAIHILGSMCTLAINRDEGRGIKIAAKKKENFTCRRQIAK